MASSRAVLTLKTTTLIVVGLLAVTDPASAQKATEPPPRVEATRAELEALAAHPPKGMSEADRNMVAMRLADGDFQVGDKLLIEVLGDTTYSDTFAVRAGRVIILPSMPPLSLVGVLRSESDSVIRTFLGKYVRDPQVQVTPLMRLGVLGGVARPGYYDVPAQSLLSDVVMGAGGLGNFGDMKKTKIFRGNAEVLDSKAVNTAITKGNTLDILNLQSGDNINVGVTNPQATLNKVQIITAILAIPLLIVSISAIAN
jgi:protein involved in polysaccharide export with SLBB domain